MAEIAEHRLRSNDHDLNRDEQTAHSALRPLDIPNESNEQDTPSPRTELLSPSSTDRRRTSHSQSATDTRRHRRESGRPKRHRDLIHSDTSHRELVRLVVEQENEAEKLRKTLYSAIQRLENESQRVKELERGNQEVAERFRQLNDSRLLAQQEATKASQELRLYQFQLETAQKQTLMAQETSKQLEKQKKDAEIMAAQARARARRLHQKHLVLQAREEGRRIGFDAGLKQSQEDYVISPTALAEMSMPEPSPTSPPDAERSRTSQQSPIDDIEDEGSEGGDNEAPETEDDGDDSFDSPISPSRTRIRRFEPIIPPGLTLQQPSPQRRQQFIPKEPLLMPTQPSGPPNHTSVSQAQPAASLQPRSREPDRSYTPSIQVYSLPIPAQENLAIANNLPPNQWVTAQKHREIYGHEGSPPAPALAQMPVPVSVPELSINPQSVPAHALRPPASAPPAPAPIFPLPETAVSNVPTAPHSAGPTPKKGVRFPTLAKTKAQASSWYRSFSLRRKSKPVIDPLEENNAPRNATATTESNVMYKYQPEPPKSWYTKGTPAKVRSQKSQDLLKPKSRAASMNDRDSVSTRLSQFDLTSTAPRQGEGEGSISGKSAHSNARKLKEKLSVIREDPFSRGNTPNIDRFTKSGTKKVVSNEFGGGAGPPPQFDRPVGAVSAQRKRPPEIYVPPPTGVEDLFVRGNYHLFPNEAHPVPPLTTPGINVQPATALLQDPPLSSAPYTGINHLTPNYTYQPPIKARTPRRDPLSYSWTSADGAIYTGTGVPLSQSNASRKSRQSVHSKSGKHRPSHSMDEGHSQRAAEVRSVRSNHSRSTSLMAPGMYPSDLVTPNGGSAYGRSTPKASRPESVRSSMSKRTDAHDNTGSQFLGDNQAINRVPSRSSMHSKYDPSTYLDPAYFSVDGQANTSAVHAQTLSPYPAGSKSHSRASLSSDLSYV